jgi:hypothetical protein
VHHCRSSRSSRWHSWNPHLRRRCRTRWWTYQGNPQLNAERARLRGVDEGVPQALSAYRPQLLATLTGGLQQVRVLFFDNTIQTATLHTWTIGLTVSQTLFNGFKTANSLTIYCWRAFAQYRRIFARAAGSSFACSSSSRAKRQQAAGVPSIAHRRNAASSLGLSTSSSAARSTTAISIMDQSASKPIANDPRPLHHCAHFAERYLTRKVPQPAVRSSHKNSTACRLVSAHQHWRVGPMF